jgi:hypothetical protein
LLPETKESERLTWADYRKTMFPLTLKAQQAAGQWGDAGIAVRLTAQCLAVLQLDNAALPIYWR